MRSPRKLFKQLSLPRGERRRRSAENGPNQQPGTTSPRLSPNEWQFAFDHVISDPEGRAQFTKFLQSEYSEENILFWSVRKR
uniref:RGS domain-containing protein n=1 Tax=Heterorhabditis bacteriophora TaxID=37862 RepID=A0A1I7X0L4_HETBA